MIKIHWTVFSEMSFDILDPTCPGFRAPYLFCWISRATVWIRIILTTAHRKMGHSCTADMAYRSDTAWCCSVVFSLFSLKGPEGDTEHLYNILQL
jgi:hypothetical protein